MCDMGMSAADIGMWGMGAMLWLGLAGLTLLGVAVAAGVWLLRRQTGTARNSSLPRPPTPLEELDRRYARGELDREEYLTRRVDLVDHWSQ